MIHKKDNAVSMAWNEPGNQRGGKDPNSNNPWGKNNEPGPPDLEQIIKKLKDKFKSFWEQKGKNQFQGFGKSGGTGGSSSGPGFFSQQKEFKPILIIILIVFCLIYIFSGFYIVEPPERSVITRFGRYVHIEGPGPHWLPVFFESREIVNVEQVATTEHSGLMLTKDRNIAQVGIAVQYRIGDDEKDVRAFLFNVNNPIHTLQLSAESALRQVVGQYTMDEVLTLKRSEITNAVKEKTIETIKNYDTGIIVLDVTMQFAKPPDEVRAAFDDVIRAAADEERLINQAHAYENQVIPAAKGTAERKKSEALAYKQEVILKAEGEVQRFNLILPEYQRAPKITQTRLYIDTMEEVLGKVNKVITDAGGNNFLFVPFEHILGRSQGTSNAETDSTQSGASSISNSSQFSQSIHSNQSNQSMSTENNSGSLKQQSINKKSNNLNIREKTQ